MIVQTPSLFTVEQYRSQVIAAATVLPQITVPLAQARDHCSAFDLPAKLNVPPFTNSAMDGFAVRFDDVKHVAKEATVTLPVDGDIQAGSIQPKDLKQGYCQRIMTGAPVPQFADTIIPVEDTNIPRGPHPLPLTVEIRKAQPYRHIRKAGEDLQAGDTVISAGTRLKASALSALASVGYGEVTVRRLPSVAVVSTGNELVPPGEPLKFGQIPDSNSVLLSALLQDFGFDCNVVTTSSDDPALFLQQLDAIASDHDVVISTGGISAGAFDVVKAALSNRGITFATVKMQPGKPQAFGTYVPENQDESASCLFLGLPGNPVSVLVSFHLFVLPALFTMAGGDPDCAHRNFWAIAGESWQSPQGRVQYLPVTIQSFTSQNVRFLPTVQPIHSLRSSSHLVGSLPATQGFAVTPQGQVEVKEGEFVRVFTWRHI